MNVVKLRKISDLVDTLIAKGEYPDFNKIKCLIDLVNNGHDLPNNIIQYVFEQNFQCALNGVDSDHAIIQLDENYWSCLGFIVTSSFIINHRKTCNRDHELIGPLHCRRGKILQIMRGGSREPPEDIAKKLEAMLASMSPPNIRPAQPPPPAPPPPDHLG